MVKKSKRIGDRESYLEHHAALLPLRSRLCPSERETQAAT
jgi:hypothetical protein